jgi:hypothetical protein
LLLVYRTPWVAEGANLKDLHGSTGFEEEAYKPPKHLTARTVNSSRNSEVGFSHPREIHG